MMLMTMTRKPCIVLLLPMKPHLPMIFHDLIVHIIQSIPSSSQDCLRCINELHPVISRVVPTAYFQIFDLDWFLLFLFYVL